MELSTHILDLVTGQPAKGVRVSLSFEGEPLGEAVTNDDGRCVNLLGDTPMKPGLYELVFHAGAYLKATQDALPDQPFFDDIPVRFVISGTERSYHVPLLISPYGYSTYRGS